MIYENWKPCTWIHPAYEVSDLGRVRREGCYLKPYLDGRGYPNVKVGDKNYRVHRLVAVAFIPNPEGLLEVNHLDEVKLNCMAFNLEWSDRLQNIEHSHCYEWSVRSPDGTVYSGRNQSAFARDNGLCPRSFRKLIKGTIQSHKGWVKL